MDEQAFTERLYLRAALRPFAGVAVRPEYGWPSCALALLDCVLSLNRPYRTMVLPRLRALAAARPEITGLAELQRAIDAAGGAASFFEGALNYRHAQRAQTLQDALHWWRAQLAACPGATERERARAWALAASPEQASGTGVRGFGLSAFQYLRMLCGAQTAKPDRHIRAFVRATIGRPVGDIEALVLLEQAAAEEGLPLREVDGAIWAARAVGNDV